MGTPEYKKLPYQMFLVVGDWSNDGHGRCEEVLVETNHPVEDIRRAYKAACKETGIAFDHDRGISDKMQISTEYESGLRLSPEIKKILISKGVNCDGIEVRNEDEDEEIGGGDVDRFTELWFDFVKIALPDLIWQKPPKDETPKINGYWDPTLNVQFGYGLFD